MSLAPTFTTMLRLGHIDYANCFPVHARFIDAGPPDGVRLRFGTPTELNAELAAGGVDVSPSSSIEYARHADRYRLLPGLAIASRGPVRSILLETRADDPARLDGALVALPTASATSVVLLRILLEYRYGVRPRYRWFDQAGRRDSPLEEGADAALWIGDDALRRGDRSPYATLDLGEAWTGWTGLPFVYALWQTSAGGDRDGELGVLHLRLLESFAYWEANAEALSRRFGERYGMRPLRLLEYWRSLAYEFDSAMRDGLLRFFSLAAELEAVPRVPALRWIAAAPRPAS